MMAIQLIPVLGKCDFYLRKVGSNQEFNWFKCACPYKDKKNNLVLKLNRDSIFFDTNTGISYRAKDDNCDLLLISDSENKRKYSFLSKYCSDDTHKFSKDCSLLKHVKDAYKHAVKLGYCGIAYKSVRCTGYPDIICEGSVVMVGTKHLEKNVDCPYIKFATSKHNYLKKVVTNFPSIQQLGNSKGGELSLRIRKIIFEGKLL